jgi:hypothetical protein
LLLQCGHCAAETGIVSEHQGQRRVCSTAGVDGVISMTGTGGPVFSPGKGAYSVPPQPGQAIHWPAHSGFVSTFFPQPQMMFGMTV